MEFRILVDDIRVLSVDGRLMAVINTSADEMETAIKDRPGTLTDRCERMAKMIREAQPPEPALRKLRDGEPCEHPGCAHHMTHPCEGCGRIGARGEPVEQLRYVSEPVYGPIQRRLDDGWPPNVSETARRMFGGDQCK